ncbi:MAG: aldehyde dehydrogenase [Oscillospiraceae bacterium]
MPKALALCILEVWQMEKAQMEQLVQHQREYFQSGAARPVETRISALRKLKSAVEHYEPDLELALYMDLGKSRGEGYMCETGLLISEIRYMLKHIRSYAHDRRVKTPLAQFAARSYVSPAPYGTVLIMSPWNYPLLLTLAPLVDAVAAGNTAVVKPSAYSPHTGEVISKLIAECFEPEYVAVILGGREENCRLLEIKFDYIFFTGSKNTAKGILHAAAENLTPVSLELGGKSPCIVDETAKLTLAAKRIVFGKFLNCGQTCVAPDYVLCHSRVRDELIVQLRRQIKLQFGEYPLENPNYGKIINKKHFDRLCSLLTDGNVITGGEHDAEKLKISPTVMTGAPLDSKLMTEEIFGPILPIIGFDTLSEAITLIENRPKPLALYLFSENKKNISEVMASCRFGGGCINDTIIHLATSEMGFGGVGESGMGAYHGKTGFETFSHYKSIVDKKTWFDMPIRYQPYGAAQEKLLRLFLR